MIGATVRRGMRARVSRPVRLAANLDLVNSGDDRLLPGPHPVTKRAACPGD